LLATNPQVSPSLTNVTPPASLAGVLPQFAGTRYRLTKRLTTL
jgi:hypothetical protein